MSEKDLENIKLPYVMKNKILMSPGVWNDYYYSEDEIRKAWVNTDWDEKDNRNLFLDHEDKKSSEWIGEVKNYKIEGDTLKGDLYIVDKPTAIKLAYGAKMGISPKVTGLTDDLESSMLDFKFNNFSVVLNPAVKTAYINMSEQENLTAFEKKRKEMGLPVDKFYAIPRDPASTSKLPIYDAAHVKNALARFNQIKGVSEEEKTKAWNKIIAAAKKFGINVSEKKHNEEVSKMSEEEIKKVEDTKEEVTEVADVEESKEETKVEETKEETKEAPAEVEEEAPVENSEKEDKKDEEKKKPTEKKPEVKAEEMSDKLNQILSAISKLTEILSKKNQEEKPIEKKPEEPVKKEEEKPEVKEKPKEEKDKDKKEDKVEDKKEMSKTMSDTQVLEEPDRQTIKGESSEELGAEENVDKAFLRVLQNY